MKKYLITILVFISILIIFNLYKNDFFSTKHIDETYGKKIEFKIPLFSYYSGNGGMIVYRFKSILPKKMLEKEKDNYLGSLKKICTNSYYDSKQDITIFSYDIEDGELFLKNIYIGIEDGKYCN